MSYNDKDEIEKRNPIDPERLKRFLAKLVDKLVPHKPDCNLVRQDGGHGYGIGCTCDARYTIEALVKEIEELN